MKGMKKKKMIWLLLLLRDMVYANLFATICYYLKKIINNNKLQTKKLIKEYEFIN